MHSLESSTVVTVLDVDWQARNFLVWGPTMSVEELVMWPTLIYR